MRAAGLAAGAVAAGLVLAVTAGCSSSPDVASQATAGRSAVLPVAQKFPAQIAATGVAWNGGITGGYEQCGANDPLASPGSSSSLQYTAQLLLTTFSRSVSYPKFQRQVVAALNGLGWALKPVTGGSPQAAYYAGRKGDIDLRLIELDQPQTFGPTATVFLSSACFDAGSSAQHYLTTSPDYNVKEPRPAGTPAPRYS